MHSSGSKSQPFKYTHSFGAANAVIHTEALTACRQSFCLRLDPCPSRSLCRCDSPPSGAAERVLRRRVAPFRELISRRAWTAESYVLFPAEDAGRKKGSVELRTAANYLQLVSDERQTTCDRALPSSAPSVQNGLHARCQLRSRYLRTFVGRVSKLAERRNGT